MGGSLRRLTRSFVGPFAVHTVLGHFADRLFLSVKGVTRDGALTDADPLEAEVKRDDDRARRRGLPADRRLQAPGARPERVGRVADLAGVFAYAAKPERARRAARRRRATSAPSSEVRA